MIWDGMAEMWQKVNREAKAARAVREARVAREAEDKNFVIIFGFLKLKKKK